MATYKGEKDSRIEDNNENVHIAAKLRNPLYGLSREELAAGVERFTQEKGLIEHTAIFQKGAILAQEPSQFETLPELDQADRDAIHHEHTHRWSHPAMLYITIGLCSIGAAVQGWDQTGSNGANLGFPQEFGIGSGSQADEWLVGVVNAGPYIGSAALGCWLSDPLNRLFGRRGTIFITAIILIATPIGSAFTHSWETLFVVRLIMGIGMGAKGATVPVLAAENSPANIRGALTMTWQFWTAFGIFLGFIANVVALVFPEQLVWRYQLGSAFIPAVPLMLIYLVPESPRWLMKKNRYPQAFKNFCRLRHTELQAARDMYFAHVQLEVEKSIVKADSYPRRFAELFTIPRNRRATIASGTVMLAQQMCGINIIAFYSSTIFRQSGFSAQEALYASLGFGAINFLFAIPAFYTIDTFGRRSLLLSTFPNMAWTLLTAGLCTLITNQQVRLALVALFIYIFAMFYSVGEGPVPFAYSAEVFPLSHREVGMSWAVTVCLGFSAILTISFPALQVAISQVGAFGFYAGLNIIAFFLIFLFVPETKQRTLEELDRIFSVKSRTFINYQMKVALPHFYRRHILRKKDTAKPEPLVSFEYAENVYDRKSEKGLEKR